MYENFYHLKAEPFRLSPDHHFCFNHQSYAKAKAYMQYAFERAEGFVMVTGRPGTGKSTLVNDLVDSLSSSGAKVAKLVSTQLEASDLLRMVAHSFGLQTEALDKATILQRLDKLLMSNHSAGRRALLIIDEAQDLSVSALEELRLLTNLQLNSQPLLQIFLLGQQELRALVQGPGMEQVQQRLVAACHLEQLKEDETKAYIIHRLEQVGWRGDPAISNAIYPAIFRFTAGVPRRINQICSRLFLHGSVEGSHKLGIDDARAVIAELQQEQLTFSDTVSEIDFNVVDEYDDFAPKVALPNASPSQESTSLDTELEAVASQVSVEGAPPVDVDNVESKLNVGSELQVLDEPENDASDMGKPFSPAAETDRSIRDHIILPPERGQREALKERLADQTAVLSNEQEDATVVVSGKGFEAAQAGFSPVAGSDLGDTLINSSRKVVKPATNWLPIITIAVVLLVGLSIAAVFVLRPKAIEPQLESVQSWLEAGSKSPSAAELDDKSDEFGGPATEVQAH
ncbi:MAG: AAA family ATPase [Gammaproteobacteria bacterium]|nr:AAA family ATPase [Gammaproteobacteria bacterium]